MLNEASPEAVQSVIQVDGHFTFIRLFIATRAAAAEIATTGPMAVDHFGGFVFVAAAVIAQTQHTDIDSWWVCREEERESRARSGGGTQGRSLSHAQEQSFHRLKRGRERAEQEAVVGPRATLSCVLGR
jgi:hypothetical protein